MKLNLFKSKLILIVVLSVIFGFGAGVVGEIITRVYLVEKAFNLPLYGEINLANSGQGNSSLIIRDAKNVTVQQDDRVAEAAKNITNNIIGIYKKKTKEQNDVNNLYFLNDEVGQGVVLTSDGWIISGNKNLAVNDKNFDNFFVATCFGKVYALDKVINDPISSYSFLHIKSVDNLSVSELVSAGDAGTGSSVILSAWGNNNIVTTISGMEIKKYYSSDFLNDELFISDNIKVGNIPSFAYDFSGRFVGVLDGANSIYPIYNLSSIISNILKNREIKRVKLGVNYINLSDYISDSLTEQLPLGAMITKNNLGVSVEKNTPAALSGLKENDIILSIDSINIDSSNHLNKIIQKHKKGDTINIVYSRKGVKSNLSLTLDEY